MGWLGWLGLGFGVGFGVGFVVGFEAGPGLGIGVGPGLGIGGFVVGLAIGIGGFVVGPAIGIGGFEVGLAIGFEFGHVVGLLLLLPTTLGRGCRGGGGRVGVLLLASFLPFPVLGLVVVVGLVVVELVELVVVVVVVGFGRTALPTPPPAKSILCHLFCPPERSVQLCVPALCALPRNPSTRRRQRQPIHHPTPTNGQL